MGLRASLLEIRAFIDFDLETLADAPPVEGIGGPCDELSTNLRTLAGCEILLNGDTDAYYHTLAQSGQVRAHFLRRCNRLPDFKSPYRATGSGVAVFDALAARNFDLAREIASLSAQEFWPGEEYEDDFAFCHFFNLFIRDDRGFIRQLETTIEQFRAALQGVESARLKICEALLHKGQPEFDEAFALLLDERSAELEEERGTFFPDDRIVYRVKSRFFIEALAILNVAEAIGIRTQEEYQYCPLIARLPMRVPFPAKRVIE